MSYQVLARKWRPRNFSEVIGQTHVLKALINALDSDRLHHAYLFTGTRGVGKTTLARVLAKALNCERGVSSQPCGECGACMEIDEGRFVDLIEVDAASRTKVDETRELLDNVQYAPTRARYKVYLIDEVHMFSNHSFNALLKTLEEPPPHVKFLLATTDPKRLPVTILSRCLQFNLTRLATSQLAAHLSTISDAEGVPYDDDALLLIAQNAAGSVRDALSLLDQSIAHGGGTVYSSEVTIMLGTVDRSHVRKLLNAVVDGDGHALVSCARGLSEFVPDYAQVLAELLSLLRRIAVVHALENRASDLESDADLLELASRITPEACQLYYQIALLGRRDLAMSPDAEAGFEMTLIRMLAFRPVADDTPVPDAGERGTTGTRDKAPVATVDTPAAPASAPAAVEVHGIVDWGRLVNELDIVGIVRELARNSAIATQSERVIELIIAPQFEKLAASRHVDALQAALREKLGRDLSLKVTVERDDSLTTPSQQQVAADAKRRRQVEAELEHDPNVQAMRTAFDATIEEVSVKTGSETEST